MARRLFASLIAISLGSWALAAAERATFVLTNGERVSGSVVFHGDNRENLINGYLNIAVDGEARERTFPIDQVALIEFVGGRPSTAELAALPDNPAHLLVMRSGDTRVGRFVNMIGGDTLKWQDNANRQTRDLPIREVARVYLNADNARRIFDYDARNRTPAGPQLPPITTAPGEIEIQANLMWNNTGITVRKGQQVAFSVRGMIAYGKGPTQIAGADGDPTARSVRAPVPIMGIGGLIGKVGNSAPFPIGNNKNSITMPIDGRLMLAVNDDDYGDNSGAYRVTISTPRR